MCRLLACYLGNFEPALISERELCARAARVRKAAVNEVRGSGDADIDEIVWQKWMKYHGDGLLDRWMRSKCLLTGHCLDDLD